jgi:hypothetical protein
MRSEHTTCRKTHHVHPAYVVKYPTHMSWGYTFPRILLAPHGITTKIKNSVSNDHHAECYPELCVSVIHDLLRDMIPVAMHLVVWEISPGLDYCI